MGNEINLLRRVLIGILIFSLFIVLLPLNALSQASTGEIRSFIPQASTPDVWHQTITLERTSVGYPQLIRYGPFYSVCYGAIELWWAGLGNAWVGLTRDTNPPYPWISLSGGHSTQVWSNVDWTKPVYIWVTSPGYITYYGDLTLGRT